MQITIVSGSQREGCVAFRMALLLKKKLDIFDERLKVFLVDLRDYSSDLILHACTLSCSEDELFVHQKRALLDSDLYILVSPIASDVAFDFEARFLSILQKQKKRITLALVEVYLGDCAAGSTNWTYGSHSVLNRICVKNGDVLIGINGDSLDERFDAELESFINELINKLNTTHSN